MIVEHRLKQRLLACVLASACVLALGGCSTKTDQGNSSGNLESMDPVSQSEVEVERPKQQIILTDEEGNEHAYDVTVEEIGGEDAPPYEGAIRMTTALTQDDAVGAVAKAIDAISNRDAETLEELGIANTSADSMESMYQQLKAVCSADAATVFLSNDAGVEPLAQINIVAPNYTTMIIAQHDANNKWSIPYIPGMLEPGESFRFESADGEAEEATADETVGEEPGDVAGDESEDSSEANLEADRQTKR